MDISHKSNQDIGPTKMSKIPTSFSIESLMSKRSCTPSRTETQSLIVQSANPHNLCIPSFPLYNPWMGYLTQSNSETLSHFINNSKEKISSLLNNTDLQHDKLSEIFLSQADPRLFINADPEYRERMSQYFANNVRDPRLTEFILSAGEQTSNNSEYANQCERLSSIETNPNSMNQHLEGVQNLSQLFIRQLPGNEDDLESVDESCSELSLTMSPEPNTGKQNIQHNV